MGRKGRAPHTIAPPPSTCYATYAPALGPRTVWPPKTHGVSEPSGPDTTRWMVWLGWPSPSIGEHSPENMRVAAPGSPKPAKVDVDDRTAPALRARHSPSDDVPRHTPTQSGRNRRSTRDTQPPKATGADPPPAHTCSSPSAWFGVGKGVPRKVKLASAGAALAAGVALDEAKQEQPLTTAAPKIAQPQGNSRKPAAKCDLASLLCFSRGIAAYSRHMHHREKLKPT